MKNILQTGVVLAILMITHAIYPGGFPSKPKVSPSAPEPRIEVNFWPGLKARRLFCSGAVHAKCETWLNLPTHNTVFQRSTKTSDGKILLTRIHLNDSLIQHGCVWPVALEGDMGPLDYAIRDRQVNVVKGLLEYLGPCDVSPLTKRTVLNRLFESVCERLKNADCVSRVCAQHKHESHLDQIKEVVADIEKMTDLIVFVMKKVRESGLVSLESASRDSDGHNFLDKKEDYDLRMRKFKLQLCPTRDSEILSQLSMGDKKILAETVLLSRSRIARSSCCA